MCKSRIFNTMSMLICLILLSCSNEMKESFDELSTRCASDNGVEMQYALDNKVIVFEDQKYRLNNDIIKSDGKISMDFIQALKKSLEEANNILENTINELERQGYTVTIEDYTYSQPISVETRVETLTSNETGGMPRGTITATSNLPVTISCDAPAAMNGVMGHCYSYVALVPVHVLKTTYAGGNAIVGTRIGNGYITVGIPMSGTTINIVYSTSDTNGGICAWEGVTI